MENLAPAGNREALERADAAGADAVYLGYTAFSARSGAGNFNRQELAEAIRFAHLRHMRVHVTVNTLAKDRELAEVAEVLLMLRELRADAVLIQDVGVLRLCRQMAPELAVHASTQMTIHNRTGVAWCARHGIRRVVLARECSLDEIQKCAETGVEIEVFGHGALCVSVSGQCLFSSMVGERSGNRGRCAQPCRKTYLYRGQEGAWLSPRDLCLLDRLPMLSGAGVSSVKIEGRLKRPEYVAVTASAYRRGLDAPDGVGFAGTKEEERALRQIFSRGAFTEGYALGCEDAGIIDSRAAGHKGLPVGTVAAVSGGLAKIRLEGELCGGDALAFHHGQVREEMVYAGRDARAGETATVRLRDGLRVSAGDAVFRLTDRKQLEDAMALPGRKVPVSLCLRAMPGEPMMLTVSDGENRVTVYGENVSEARTRPASEEELIRGLRKMGETVFVPDSFRVESRGAFVPVGQLNALRREALERLAEERIRAFEEDFVCGLRERERFQNSQPKSMADANEQFPEEEPGTPLDEDVTPALPPVEIPPAKLPPMAKVRTAAQAKAARQAGFRVIRDPEDLRREALSALLAGMETGDWLQLPSVCEEETLEMFRELCERWREKLGGVVLGSVGQLGVSWPVPYGAGSGIPVMNRQAAAFLLEEGCAFVTASEELTGAELKTLTAGGAPVVVKVWGRTQLMLLHHCPARTARGLTSGHRLCDWCDRGSPEALRDTALEDPRGYAFPLLRQRLEEGCMVRLMNMRPVELTDRARGLNPMAELTVESPEEAETVFAAIEQHRKTGMPATSGHWQRPVE